MHSNIFLLKQLVSVTYLTTEFCYLIINIDAKFWVSHNVSGEMETDLMSGFNNTPTKRFQIHLVPLMFSCLHVLRSDVFFLTSGMYSRHYKNIFVICLVTTITWNSCCARIYDAVLEKDSCSQRWYLNKLYLPPTKCLQNVFCGRLVKFIQVSISSHYINSFLVLHS